MQSIYACKDNLQIVQEIANWWFSKYQSEYRRAEIASAEDLQQEIWCGLLGYEIPREKTDHFYHIVFLCDNKEENRWRYHDAMISRRELEIESDRYLHLYANKYLDTRPETLSREYFKGEFRERERAAECRLQFDWSGNFMESRSNRIADKLRKRGDIMPREIPVSQLSKQERADIANLFHSSGVGEDDYREESFA